MLSGDLARPCRGGLSRPDAVRALPLRFWCIVEFLVSFKIKHVNEIPIEATYQTFLLAKLIRTVMPCFLMVCQVSISALATKAYANGDSSIRIVGLSSLESTPNGD
jgi:hypothetical protein